MGQTTSYTRNFRTSRNTKSTILPSSSHSSSTNPAIEYPHKPYAGLPMISTQCQYSSAPSSTDLHISTPRFLKDMAHRLSVVESGARRLRDASIQPLLVLLFCSWSWFLRAILEAVLTIERQVKGYNSMFFSARNQLATSPRNDSDVLWSSPLIPGYTMWVKVGRTRANAR